ncbi:hypothetical protein IJS77_01475 [bacterium]|nr:hypothetical protein [bacterium]
MFWLLSRLIKNIAYAFRVFQFILLIYLVGDILYWFFALGKSFIADFFAPAYSLPLGIVKNIADALNWEIGKNFPLLQLDILLSIFVVIIVLIISNFLFIGLGALEKFLVEKAYDRGEKDYE